MTTILTTDIAPPGVSGDVAFISFSGPVINNRGDVIFEGAYQLQPSGVFAGTGLWAWDGQSVTSLIQTGESLPDFAPGEVIAQVTYNSDVPQLDDHGRVLIRSVLGGPGVGSSNDRAILHYVDGVWSVLAREGSPAPGIGLGATWSTLNRGSLIGTSEVMLDGRSAFGSGGRTHLYGTPGAMTVVATDGGTLPGLASDEFTGSFTYHRVESSGHLLLRAGLESESGFPVGGGMWVGTPDNLQLVARSGDLAHGFTNGEIYRGSFAPHSLSTSGRLAYAAVVEAGEDSAYVLFSGTPDNIVPIAGPLDSLEDSLPVGWSWGNMQEAFPYVNDAGVVVFQSTLRDDNDVPFDSLWLYESGQLELIFLDADPAVGVEEGVVHGVLRPTDFSPIINDRNQVLFGTQFFGDTIDETNSRGLYLYDEGELELVLRTGDWVPVTLTDGTTELRQVADYAVSQRGSIGSNGADNNPVGFNQESQFVVALEFVDGSEGVFLYDLQTTLPGDIDGDGFVGVADLDILLANWGEQVGSRLTSAGDLSGDSWVGQADLDLLMDAWGDGTLPGTVPEPGTLALLGLGGVVIGRRRIRQGPHAL